MPTGHQEKSAMLAQCAIYHTEEPFVHGEIQGFHKSLKRLTINCSPTVLLLGLKELGIRIWAHWI